MAQKSERVAKVSIISAKADKAQPTKIKVDRTLLNLNYEKC